VRVAWDDLRVSTRAALRRASAGDVALDSKSAAELASIAAGEITIDGAPSDARAQRAGLAVAAHVASLTTDRAVAADHDEHAPITTSPKPPAPTRTVERYMTAGPDPERAALAARVAAAAARDRDDDTDDEDEDAHDIMDPACRCAACAEARRREERDSMSKKRETTFGTGAMAITVEFPPLDNAQDFALAPRPSKREQTRAIMARELGMSAEDAALVSDAHLLTMASAHLHARGAR
jgi:hypothetical protein